MARRERFPIVPARRWVQVVSLRDSGDVAPYEVALDREGNLCWTNAAAGTIAHLSPEGQVEIVLAGLDHPYGLALDESRELLFFTELPTPGVPGSSGGRNTVNSLDLATRERTVLFRGDSEPSDVAVSPMGRVFWTSTVRARPKCGRGRGRLVLGRREAQWRSTNAGRREPLPCPRPTGRPASDRSGQP